MRKSLFSNEYDTFLSMLKEHRKSSGITQVELAKRLKESQSFVSKCERGERRLDLLETRIWCKALKLPFLEFVKKLDRKLSRLS